MSTALKSNGTLAIRMKLLIRIVLFTLATIGTWLALTKGETGAATQISGTLASIAATLLGFMVAALSILVAIDDRPLVKNMKKTGHYRNLINSVYNASAVYLITLVCALIGLFLPSESQQIFMAAVTTGFMAHALVLTASAGYKFLTLIEHL